MKPTQINVRSGEGGAVIGRLDVTDATALPAVVKITEPGAHGWVEVCDGDSVVTGFAMEYQGLLAPRDTVTVTIRSEA